MISLNEVIDELGIRESVEAYVTVWMMHKTKWDLQKNCRKRGISDEGTKRQLVNRIRKHNNEH